MDVDGSRSSLLSIPYLTLDSLMMEFPLHQYLLRTPLTFAEHPNTIKISISGLLGRSLAGDSGDSKWERETSDTDSVQSVFDGLVDAMYKSLHGRQYDSVVLVVDAVRDALVLSFKSSPIAKYLNLADIEVTLEGASGQRVASNTLYQSNRIVRPPKVLIRPQVSREVVVDGLSRAMTLEAAHARHSHFDL